MTEIHLRHEEANIECTAVLLKCKYEAGEIPLPLAVQMAPMNRREDAWRAAAINHLNGATVEKEKKSLEHAREQQFLEENERLDWEERHGRG